MPKRNKSIKRNNKKPPPFQAEVALGIGKQHYLPFRAMWNKWIRGSVSKTDLVTGYVLILNDRQSALIKSCTIKVQNTQ